MKRFILSDLHIGHPEAQYEAMDQSINYIEQNAEAGDQIWGLGDWFHMKEMGFDYCISQPMTQKYVGLARRITTKLVPGNHDGQLKEFVHDSGSVNPISPIEIVVPFWENGFFYCHGDEYDPVAEHFGWFPAFWDRLRHKRTPGDLKSDTTTEQFLIAAQLVHSSALIEVAKKAKDEGKDCKGIVLGHTHLPMIQEAPELPYLLNDGDMRHSATFVVQDDDGFHLMRWNYSQNHWLVTSSLRP
jgi:UDP-2,3-diacylglucosamine pyrophosphatase LpxH